MKLHVHVFMMSELFALIRRDFSTESSRDQVNVFLKQLADGLRSMKHIKNISFVLWYKGNVHA